NLIYFFKKSQKSISTLLIKKFNGHVHQHTLSILKKITEQNHKLSNDLIELIAQFLFDHDMTIVTNTADILLYHVEYNLLSQNIVDMIERILQNRSDQDTLIQILRKCAFNQCILTEKTLITLSNLLFESTKEMRRNNIILTLEFADRNQQLPEVINNLLKYEYYVKILTNSVCENEAKDAEQQLNMATLNGKQLSKGILNSGSSSVISTFTRTADGRMILWGVVKHDYMVNSCILYRIHLITSAALAIYKDYFEVPYLKQPEQLYRQDCS
ncbi:unnamed protein product, partial [Rotaria sp. Silwood2]